MNGARCLTHRNLSKERSYDIIFRLSFTVNRMVKASKPINMVTKWSEKNYFGAKMEMDD